MPKHLTEGTTNLAQAFPGFGSGNAVTVPTTVGLRWVYGTFRETTGGGLHTLSVFVEDSVGAGTHSKIFDITARGDGKEFMFPVPGGREYYFDESGAATPSVPEYSYTDT